MLAAVPHRELRITNNQFFRQLSWIGHTKQCYNTSRLLFINFVNSKIPNEAFKIIGLKYYSWSKRSKILLSLNFNISCSTFKKPCWVYFSHETADFHPFHASCKKFRITLYWNEPRASILCLFVTVKAICVPSQCFDTGQPVFTILLSLGRDGDGENAKKLHSLFYSSITYCRRKRPTFTVLRYDHS